MRPEATALEAGTRVARHRFWVADPSARGGGWGLPASFSGESPRASWSHNFGRSGALQKLAP